MPLIQRTDEEKREIDADRRTLGLPPIFTKTPRPLTEDERRARDESCYGLVFHSLPEAVQRKCLEPKSDIIIRGRDGEVTHHYVPMCKDGWSIYVDVLNWSDAVSD